MGIGDLKFTDDYLKEKINFDKFLEKILKSNGEKFLVHNVNHDEGLVESANNDASTWLALSKEKESKIAYCLKDDEGEYELDFYDITVEGLDKCICKVYEQQDETDDPEKFKEKLMTILNNI